MTNDPQRLFGLPVIRAGDTVVIIGQLPDLKQMTYSAEHMSARFEHYRCPFDFIDEFDQWWEWQRRTQFERQSTGMVTCDMVRDLDQIKANKIDPPFRFRASMDFGASIAPRNTFLIRGSV